MPSTTNFGWTTPADTDLVKDGAAAIRTLGNGIDASFLDLKGGTTGQILSKNSNTDLDYTWITPQVGDITAVTAGTGLSGGGTSGDVTLTNTVATAFDAKADLIVGTGADTFAKLTVGANDTVLTADSTTATGLKWATVASPDWTFSAWSPTYQNLTIGNGTVTARYAQKGKLVVAWWKLLFGSTTSVSGQMTVSTPVNPYTNYAYSTIVEAQAGNVNYIMSTTALSNSWYLRAINTSSTYASITATSSTVPGTWTHTQGDYIGLVSVYEAA